MDEDERAAAARERRTRARDDEARRRDRFEERVLRRIREHRVCDDADDALHGDRRVRQQAARVPAAARGAGADQPDRHVCGSGEIRRRAREPPSRAACRRRGRTRRAPAVQSTSGPVTTPTSAGERSKRSGSAVGRDEHQPDVPPAREPDDVLCGLRGRERGAAGAERARCRVDSGGRIRQSRLVVDEPHHDPLYLRQRPDERGEPFERRLVGRGREHRGARLRRALEREAGILPEDPALELL